MQQTPLQFEACKHNMVCHSNLLKLCYARGNTESVLKVVFFLYVTAGIVILMGHKLHQVQRGLIHQSSAWAPSSPPTSQVYNVVLRQGCRCQLGLPRPAFMPLDAI